MYKEAICMIILLQRRREGTEVYWSKFLYTIEIKLELIQSRLFQVKMLVVISSATTKNLTKKYIIIKEI